MFRRFEPLIAEGVKNYPAPTTFAPQDGMGPTTFVARFRDAMTSFRRFGWSTNLIDVEKFNSLGAAIVIRHDLVNGTAVFDVRHAAGKAPAGLTVPNSFVPDAKKATPNGVQTDLTHDELTAFCLLLSKHRISGPVLVKGEISSDQISSLTNRFDVGINFDPLSNTTVIL
jgi:hypothetical protein